MIKLPYYSRSEDVPVPEGWGVMRIEEIHEQLPIGRRRDSRTCGPLGSVPVVDQSSSEYLGFHSDEAGVIASRTHPVVTFANHTCEMRIMREPFSVIQNVFPKVGKKNVATTLYLYYATKGRIGSTSYKGHHPEWREGYLPVPPLRVQEAITSFLFAYDELIENNLRRIGILEEMAQAIYREWFVNFRFPGQLSTSVPQPEQWETLNLFDVASVRYGFGFKSKGFHNGPTGRRVVRIRDVPKNSTSTYTDEDPGEDYEVTDGDILVGMDGDFHMCVWHDSDAMLNQRVARVRPKIDAPVLWLFHALRGPISHFNSTITGTTVAHLGDRHLRTVELPVPPEPLMALAQQLLNPIERLIRNLRQQNANLRTTRDLLLPKLISGEIDVSELDIDTSWLAA